MDRALIANPMDNFTYRDARPEDREEIFAFTANTWEHGDYISYVFDDWLADRSGLFLVIEDTSTNRIAGLDKLTMIALGEAWFEGLRIRQEYRGRGLATQVQRHMIGEARRLGASTVRLLTRVNNVPIHLAAYRDGFSRIAHVRGFNWKLASATGQTPTTEVYNLRPATPEEAPILYHGWRQSSAYRVSGLVNHSWSFRSTNVQEWRDAANNGLLLTESDAVPDPNRLPVPCVLLLPDGEKVDHAWTVSTISATHAEWAPLLLGLFAAAQRQGITDIEGLLPDDHLLYTATLAAGVQPHADDHTHCVYQLDL
jgi:GNAT superfamily N-acetyltransferase